MKLLCPTDFSESAYNALEYASSFAQSMKGEITIFHVHSMWDIPNQEILKEGMYEPEVLQTHLDNQCREVTKAFQVPCDSKVQSSLRSLPQLISKQAADFDLIVMGTNGADDYFQFLFGSNTYRALRDADKPLILVPYGFTFKPLKRMVYAFDYLSTHELPMTQLVKWANILKCEVCVLQVANESDPEAQTRMLAIQRSIKNLYDTDLVLTFDSVHSNNVAQAIDRYMMDSDADMLALDLHHRPFLERLFHKSVAKQISALASYPVFVLHAIFPQ